ncbi:putative glucan 1,3-beta-glucosidase precursor [Talaromyces proteolyticus]|uniref:Glucan 1,3-beta-glucosidase n=1 Tax=Talaromyces proteolyticus TaxID=1131652 RepID=A0AAD4KJD4_9EURO|nr:putative glucan 1,3-beta-glucosidase precursor [Talaromyces proteolyticus]KAH8692840.1 putative glucan 1,3-beta-glucosidase precursor [Talaromyces proteolyticus]
MDPKTKDPPPPTVEDIFRYRYQHGTNLGSIYVLEKWLHRSMFEKDAPGSSELAAVKQSLRHNGLEATRLKWEKHWKSALKDSDFHWLNNVARCNSIRLPIGYYTLGPQFCAGTPFEGEPAQVYLNAWDSVKALIDACYQEGIGVLIDLHALPGGANKDSHSGTDSGNAELWKVGHYLSVATDCVTHILCEVTAHKMSNVIGIELCNEPSWDAGPSLWKWYDDVLALASGIDSSLPIYIGDCWNLPVALDYASKKNAFDATTATLLNPVIVDTHKYYTFTANDHSQSPQQIITRAKESLAVASGKQGNVFGRKTAVSVYVGEYSCTLDIKTWNRVNASERPTLTQEFGQAQSDRYQNKACGSAFWTLKMDWMDGGDWGFKKQVNTGAIPPPRGLTLSKDDVGSKIRRAEIQRPTLLDATLSQHVAYWKKTVPNKTFEHWRYESGWNLGFKDAGVFFCARINGLVPDGQQSAGGDKIGALEMWIRKRLFDAGQLTSPFGWQWEQGYRKGVKHFYEAVAI